MVSLKRRIRTSAIEAVVVGDDRHPLARVAPGGIVQRTGSDRPAKDLDLGNGRPLEAFDQDDVGAGEVLAREADRIVVLGRAVEERPHVGAHQEHPLRAALVEVPPAVHAGLVHLGGVVGVLHGHDPVAPAHELARQGDRQGRLSGVLPADDGDDSRRHSSSVRARSSAVFTLKNRTSGSP